MRLKAQVNPKSPSDGVDRVIRGGGWPLLVRFCCVASRARNPPGNRYDVLGFRVLHVSEEAK